METVPNHEFTIVLSKFYDERERERERELYVTLRLFIKNTLITNFSSEKLKPLKWHAKMTCRYSKYFLASIEKDIVSK